MLTNRYSRDKPDATAGGRFDPNTDPGALARRRYHQEADFDALDILRPVAQKHGLTEIECALRWLSHHSQLNDENGDGVVIGSSSPKQLRENMDAPSEGGCRCFKPGMGNHSWKGASLLALIHFVIP